jgi:hypothetical protein
MLLQKTPESDEEVQEVVYKWLHMQTFFLLGLNSETLNDVHPKQWGLCSRITSCIKTIHIQLADKKISLLHFTYICFCCKGKGVV